MRMNGISFFYETDRFLAKEGLRPLTKEYELTQFQVSSVYRDASTLDE
jgi:hypothetical protein